ncbi:MAG: hypothetical protein SVY10_21115 [Thermodesulfobacteriota bacterium]|nr:hypothetical protein [Thermodesulfobacteriota bacterium]
MNEKANPIPRLGERNLYCPYYDDCLDHAVKHRWQSWNCFQCSNKSMQQTITVYECRVDNSDLYYNVSPEIARRIEEYSLD